MSEQTGDTATSMNKPHVCPLRLTPAAQAVLDAAVKFVESELDYFSYADLLDAIRRYREEGHP